MQVQDPKPIPIPAQRKVRKDTDLSQFLAADMASYVATATAWVRQTSKDVLKQVVDAGNPPKYFVTIDGVMNANGTVKRAFRAGVIDQSERAVRIEFNAENLGSIARSASQYLFTTIRQTFPKSETGRLSHEWSWWLKRAGEDRSRRIGKTPPTDLSIEDVLYLAPDFYVARYAYFANRTSKGSFGAKFNLYRKTAHIITHDGRTEKVKVEALRKRLRGFVARATASMRFRKVPGVLFQGGFTRKYLSGPASKHPFGVPFVRIAFKGALKYGVDV
jgi:hypothetical protein